MLDADPTSDITNIRKIRQVIKEGIVVDLDRLPTKPIYARTP